jgi:hypothetical protein
MVLSRHIIGRASLLASRIPGEGRFFSGIKSRKATLCRFAASWIECQAKVKLGPTKFWRSWFSGIKIYLSLGVEQVEHWAYRKVCRLQAALNVESL